MAGGGGGGGDKRSANADINLVPYIDLLSTLICFLLITAVWQQVSVITTNSQPTPPEDAFNPAPQDPNKVDLSLKIFQDYMEVKAGPNTKVVNHVSGHIDKETLKPIIASWKKQYPQIQDVTINSAASIPYKFLIQTMDILIEQNYIGLSINTN